MDFTNNFPRYYASMFDVICLTDLAGVVTHPKCSAKSSTYQSHETL